MSRRTWDQVRVGGLGAKLIERVLSRDLRACRYCGSSERVGVDHVVPRSQGGADSEENMVAACRKCNARKGKRSIEKAGMVLLNRQQQRSLIRMRSSVDIRYDVKH